MNQPSHVTGSQAIAHAGTTARHSRMINASRNREKGIMGIKYVVVCPGCERKVTINPTTSVFSHTCGERFRFTKGHR
jgi:hypothetical protein